MDLVVGVGDDQDETIQDSEFASLSLEQTHVLT
jgi:hypothetical protein